MEPKEFTTPRDILSFDEEKGKIFLNDSRVIIMNTSALGLLRQDLITALGSERAKGFLMRHGWHHGSNDASYLKHRYKTDHGIEWLLMGPRMHNMTGVAKVEVKEAIWEASSNKFYMEGYWYDSYEADLHLKAFGHHHDPVCSTLIGYASGYVSEYIGLPVLFREIQCKAAGAPYCHWVGRVMNEWDPISQRDQAYFEEKRLGDELDQAYMRIEKQNEALKLAMKVHQRLTHILTNGGSLQEIIHSLYQLVGHPVIIEDEYFQILEVAGIERDDATALGASVAELLSRAERTPAYHYMVERLRSRKQTVEITVPPEYESPHSRIITPILVSNEVYGYISFVSGQITEREILSLERAASSCALYILNRRTAVEIEERLKEDMFDSLLQATDPIPLLHRAKLLGFDLTGSFCIVLLEEEKQACLSSKEQQLHSWESRATVIEYIQKICKRKNVKCLITQKSGRIVSIFPRCYFKNSNSVKEDVLDIVHQLSQRFGKNFMAAISSFSEEIRELQRCYSEAIKVLQVQSVQKSLRPVASFADLGVIGILIQSENPEGMLRFVNQWIGELIKYDQKNHAEMTRTLYYYLENDANLYRTAQVLNLSIGGLRYRIRRIMEIVQYDLSDTGIRFEIQLALKLLNLLKPECMTTVE